MRNYMIFLPIFVFLVVGCGNRDSGDSGGGQNIVPEVPVVVEPIPTYDLVEYMFPELNQSNFYQESIFEKIGQSRGAKYADLNQTIYYDKSYTTIDSIIELVIDGVYEYDYEIEYDIITTVDLLNSETSFIDRVVEIGDTITNSTRTDVINGLDNVSSYVCVIDNYLDEKMIDNNPNAIYFDVIEKICTKTYYANGTIYDIDTIISGTVTESYFYAKGVGLISSVVDDCKSITLGTTAPTYNCLKTEATLIYEKPF